jgi:hypothetical protein
MLLRPASSGQSLLTSTRPRDAVVSFDHEFVVDLFRKNGKLAVELLRSCAQIEIEHASVAHDSIDLSQVAPTSYFADAVVVLRDRAACPVSGIIVEVQRDEDHRKRRSWPSYVTNLRAKLDCAALLLVIVPGPTVAAWARQTIETGHPGFHLTPIVIELADIPWIRDRHAALQLPQLAVLSALAHPDLEIAELAIEAVAPLPEELARLYLDVIIAALPASLRQTLEARMQHYEYKSDFARRYYSQGRQEGIDEGRLAGIDEGRLAGIDEGRLAGIDEGRLAGLQAAAIALARTRLDALSDADVAAIQAATDPDVLTELVTALGTARSRAKARMAFDRALAR